MKRAASGRLVSVPAGRARPVARVRLLVERSAHDGGGRLHPHERSKEEPMAEQKPRAPRARKKAAETEPVAAKAAPKKKAASTTPGGDRASRRRRSRPTSPFAPTCSGSRASRAMQPSTGCGPSRSCWPRRPPTDAPRGRSNPGARTAATPPADRRRRACSPQARKGLRAFPRAEPGRSTRRPYDDLQTRRLGGSFSSRAGGGTNG